MSFLKVCASGCVLLGAGRFVALFVTLLAQGNDGDYVIATGGLLSLGYCVYMALFTIWCHE